MRLASVFSLIFLMALSVVSLAPRVTLGEDKDHGHDVKSSSGDHSAAGKEHGSGGHGGDENPLTPSVDLGLWSLVTFILFALLLSTMAWGPLQDGLGKRESKIRDDIAQAEAARHKAEAMLKDYEAKLSQVQEQVKEILAEARRDAESTKSDIIATAQKEAEATKQRAVVEIERARDSALSELFDYVTSNVVHATEKVVGRSLTGDDHQRLVQQALSELNVQRN